MKIIHEILKSAYLKEQPPVLVDIGASGEINRKWAVIAPYSICIAFDADDREFAVNEQTSKGYRKLITFNRIVAAGTSGTEPFYLTASPFCSSLLEPDLEKLQPWSFQKLFEVNKAVSLPAITLSASMQQAGVSQIDWLKTDTQGTDLRLFRSLPDDLKNNIVAAEFEPGIIDAFKGEDKLYQVMEEMERQHFWLSAMDLKGTQRLTPGHLDRMGEGYVKRVIRRSPCWAEVTYLRQPQILTSQRQFLLLYIFALLEEQWGFALEVAETAQATYKDEIFESCRKEALKIIRTAKWKIPLVIFKRQFNKLLSGIND